MFKCRVSRAGSPAVREAQCGVFQVEMSVVTMMSSGILSVDDGLVDFRGVDLIVKTG